jgi:hypothetical protein
MSALALDEYELSDPPDGAIEIWDPQDDGLLLDYELSGIPKGACSINPAPFKLKDRRGDFYNLIATLFVKKLQLQGQTDPSLFTPTGEQS